MCFAASHPASEFAIIAVGAAFHGAAPKANYFTYP